MIGADRLDAPAGVDADRHANQSCPTRSNGSPAVAAWTWCWTPWGALFEPSLRSLRSGGRQVALTSVGNRRVEFDLTDFYHNTLRLFGIDTMKLSGAEIASIMNELRKGFDEGALAPPVVTVWLLARAVEAYTAVEQGAAPAKHVLSLRTDTGGDATR